MSLPDIRLPDINGIEVLVKLHRDAPRMVKIMITGYPSGEDAEEVFNKGASA